MIVRQPRYSKEEFAKAGDEIYEFQVCPQVETGNHVKLTQVKSLLAIASKSIIQMLKSGLSALALAMSVDQEFDVQNIITIPAKNATNC